MEGLGFARESRLYRPHLTLARIRGRPPVELDELVEAFDEVRLSELTCTEFELIRSELGSGGPRYLSHIHISEPTRRYAISNAVFC